MTPITEQHRKAAAEVAEYVVQLESWPMTDGCSVDAIAAILARWESQELGQWQRFASYCRSCAMSGEFPLLFEEFQHREASAPARGRRKG
jgi:hypothetical protein